MVETAGGNKKVNNTYFSKINQMRSLDLQFRPKNQIFDLDRLIEPLNQKKIEAKIEETIKFETL